MGNALRKSAASTMMGIGLSCAAAVTYNYHDPPIEHLAPDLARLMPPTFPTNADGHVPFHPFIGSWTGSGKDQRLVLAPRLPPKPATDTAAVLFGAIPSGKLEGAMLFEAPGTASPAPGHLDGVLVLADETLERKRVRLTIEGDPPRLQVDVSGEESFVLERRAGIDLELLARIRIIGHRGLGFHDELENSLEALGAAWLFGCSGVELDITVPYSSVDGGEVPRPDQMRVHHPPDFRVEITGDDSDALADIAGLPTPRHALEAVATTGIRLVYLDPKLKWLFPDSAAAAARSLHALTTLGREWSSGEEGVGVGVGVGVAVIVGAETSDSGEAADLLAADLSSEPIGEARVAWALEYTRGTDPQRFLDYARRVFEDGDGSSGPGVLSVNLLRISGSNKGLLGTLLANMTEEEEEIYRSFPQPLILWTAYSEDEFDGAIQAALRLAGSSEAEERPIAIMTPYPHRLAYKLAAGSLTR